MANNRKNFEKRLQALKVPYNQMKPYWSQLSDYISPLTSRFLASDTDTVKINNKINNNTATLAARTFAAGMMSGATSPARPWFKVGFHDTTVADNFEVKAWASEVARRMRAVFNQSNIYNSLPVFYEQLGVYGTACLVLEDDFEDVIRTSVLPVGSYYIAQNERGYVDTLYREYTQTVDQLVRKFGISKVSDSVKTQYENGNWHEKHEIVHAVEPNDDYKEGSPLSKHKRYVSVRYEKAGTGENQFLSELGFDSFPYFVARAGLNGEDVWGTNCSGMVALPDVKALQVMQKEKGKAIQKMVSPPLVGGSNLKNKPVSVLPSGLTFDDSMNSQQGLRPVYEVNPRIAELQEDMYETRNRIMQAFYADLFAMMLESDRRQITAREVDERHEEKLVLLSPLLERLHSEVLKPLVDRVFERMVEVDIIPPAPEVISGTELKVEFISMLAQAQQAVGIGAIERLSAYVAQIVQIEPSARHKIDWLQSIEDYAESAGVNPKQVRSNDDVDGIVQKEAQASAQAQAAESVQAMANTAKTMSETEATDADLLGQLGLT